MVYIKKSPLSMQSFGRYSSYVAGVLQVCYEYVMSVLQVCNEFVTSELPVC